MSDQLVVEKLSDYFDAVIMLTWSNWATEPRSNRYHYATRFASRLPTYFVQPQLEPGNLLEEDSGVPNLAIVKCAATHDQDQVETLKAYLRSKGIRRPLLWMYNFHFENFQLASPEWFTAFHATEDYTVTELSFFNELQRAQVRRVVPACDLLVAVSERLRRNYVDRMALRIPTITLANGCDYEFWRTSGAYNFAPGSDGAKVAFYQGGVNVRLDFGLLESLVERMPDWNFSFCGLADEREHMREEMAPWARLKNRPNVRYHGAVSPEEIAALSKQSTVGLIPFRDVDMIRISLPLKAYEYVACGLPVVSVPIDALEADPENFAIARTAAEFEADIRALAPSRSDPRSIDRRMAAAKAAGYDERFRELEEEICRLLRAKLSREKSLNVLMLHDDAFAHIKTIQEHLRAFSSHSRHNYFFFPTSDNPSWKMFDEYEYYWPDAWNLDRFDAVVWHYGMTAALPDFFSTIVGEHLARYEGLKVLFIQDEYESTHVIWDWIRKAGIHLVMTCTPPEGRELVYPPETHRGVEFIQTLTGFVPEDEGLDFFITPIEQRQTRIGYRGRILPFHYGSLGWDKFRIGRDVLRLAEERGIPVDIEVDDWKRIYGEDWYRFLGSVRATLGTESGSNVFDFDGTLKPHAMAAREAGEPFEKYFAEHLAHREGFIKMNQVSPKIFEAIRLRTALVCFEGEYSGVIKKDEHYIPLAMDYSNIDEVFEKLEDVRYLKALTDRAYRDVIESGRYTYRGFVQKFDDILERRVLRPTKAEIFSLPVACRARGDDQLRAIIRKGPFETILTTGVLRRPFERRDFATLMAGVREAERSAAET